MVQVINTLFPIKAFADSRIGGRSENQDTCAWTDTPVGLLILVCDGMGGGPGGKTASMIAAKVISDHLRDVKNNNRAAEELAAAIDLANAAILAASGSNYPVVNGKEYSLAQILPEGIKPQPQLNGMGSTVAAVLINKEHAIVAHVGDSRVYQLRGKKIVYRSTDHSHVMDLVKSHVIDEEQARLSGESNIITQALGHAYGPLKSDVTILPYIKGDRFVLCSDGIWGMYPQKKLIDMIAASSNGAGAVDSVVVSVDNEGTTNGGGHDNLTLAIADVTVNSKDPVKMTRIQKIMMYGLAIIASLSIILNLIQWNCRPSISEKEPHESEQPRGGASGSQENGGQGDNNGGQGDNNGGQGDNKGNPDDETASAIQKLRLRLEAIVQKIDGLKKINDASLRIEPAEKIAEDLNAIVPELKNYGIPSDPVAVAATELRKLKGDRYNNNKNESNGQIFTIHKNLKRDIPKMFNQQ